jgi:diamine N-acetyltransferase
VADRSRPLIEALDSWAAVHAAEDAETAARPRPRAVRDGGRVELREVTGESVRAICRLMVAPAQRGFVAPNAVSFAEAHYEPKAWIRAVYADDIPVGFAMLYLDSDKPEYYLWRYMVAAEFQGRGYGRAAIALVVEHVRSLPGATQLLVSWVPGEGGPELFYRGLGFNPTGVVEDGEVQASLLL